MSTISSLDSSISSGDTEILRKCKWCTSVYDSKRKLKSHKRKRHPDLVYNEMQRKLQEISALISRKPRIICKDPSSDEGSDDTSSSTTNYNKTVDTGSSVENEEPIIVRNHSTDGNLKRSRSSPSISWAETNHEVSYQGCNQKSHKKAKVIKSILSLQEAAASENMNETRTLQTFKCTPGSLSNIEQIFGDPTHLQASPRFQPMVIIKKLRMKVITKAIVEKQKYQVPRKPTAGNTKYSLRTKVDMPHAHAKTEASEDFCLATADRIKEQIVEDPLENVSEQIPNTCLRSPDHTNEDFEAPSEDEVMSEDNYASTKPVSPNHIGFRKCHVCNKPLPYSKTDKTKFYEHVKIHSGLLPYFCPFKDCGRSFADPVELLSHSSYAHTGDEVFECDICGTKFSLKRKFTFHKKTCRPGK